MAEKQGVEAVRIEKLPESKHIFTHKEWHMTGYQVLVDELEPMGQMNPPFVETQEIEGNYPIPSAFAASQRLSENSDRYPEDERNNTMKLLSIAIPCYNSQDYMAHCIESLLPGGEDVEILIVNDGSKDDTAKIADEYAAKYPTIVKAIHKENGGHGSAVNTGIENATGIYFKVVDSDDWVKEDAYLAILEKLRELTGGVDTLDLLISNFVYEKEGERRKKVMRYKHVLPEYRMFGWEDVGRFHVGQYILMHSVIYRTKLLRECGLKSFSGAYVLCGQYLCL